MEIEVHYRRRYPRHRTRANLFSMSGWPAWHDVVYHRRPHRRATARLEHAILVGAVDVDDIVWPLHKKPHRYYW